MLYMSLATNSVKCNFPSAEPEIDDACVCGSCGSNRGICQWVPPEEEAVQSWHTMCLKSRSKFKFCAAWRKDLKGRGKDKGIYNVEPIHRQVDSDPGSVFVVHPFDAEATAASLQDPSDVSDHKRVY